MNKHNALLFIGLLVASIGLLSACTAQKVLAPDRVSDQPSTPVDIEIDDFKLIGLRADRVDSYQTHYIMTYPPTGHQFIVVDTAIEGPEDPERWGQDNLQLGDNQDRFEPIHVRRVLIGDQYEYLADEDFLFRYQFFFSTPRSKDPAALTLFIADLQTLSMDRIYSPPPQELNADSSHRTDVSRGQRSEITVGEQSVIAGGSSNQASATHTTVSGGQLNRATVAYSTVGGGRENTASYLYSTIAGGYANSAEGRESTVAGGSRNTASGDHAAVGGGIRNEARATDTTISGGGYNLTDEIYAAVGGGTRNIAGGAAAVVSGGAGNQALGDNSSIIGGLANLAPGNYSALLGGHQNTASGDYSSTLGGLANSAAGDFSTAAGHGSNVASEHQGSFLYADSVNFPFYSQSADEFAVRATGGVRIVSGIDSQGRPQVGVQLPAGSGSWEVFSSRSTKTNLHTVQTDEILAELLELPLYSWTYRTEPNNAVHLGPIAEDFHASFNLGGNPQTIATVDSDGVALAALQEVAKRLMIEEKKSALQNQRITQIERQIEDLEAANISLERERTFLLSLAALLGVLASASLRRATHGDV